MAIDMKVITDQIGKIPDPLKTDLLNVLPTFGGDVRKALAQQFFNYFTAGDVQTASKMIVMAETGDQMVADAQRETATEQAEVYANAANVEKWKALGQTIIKDAFIVASMILLAPVGL